MGEGINRKRITGLGLHCHHDGLFEYVLDYDERCSFIQSNKPPEERELRLALFIIVPVDVIPETLRHVIDEWERVDAEKDRINTELMRVRDEWDPLWTKRDRVIAERARILAEWGYVRGKLEHALASIDQEALHRQLCHPNCPWDGKTIFAKGYDAKKILVGEREGT